MGDSGLQVVFDGRLAEGTDPTQAKTRLASLFKTDVARIEPLFSGRPTVVKKGLDAATAEKYRRAFEQAGAIATVVDPDAPPAPTAPAAAPGAPAAAGDDAPPVENKVEDKGESKGEDTDEGDAGSTPSRLQVAEASRAPPPLVARGAATGSTDLSMADPGAMLVDAPRAVEAPAFDTSHMSLAEPGVDLAEHEEVEAPEFDLAGYELAPPGEPLRDD